MDRLRLDLSHAWRTLTRRPAYFMTTVATLTLVLGANAAMFAVVSATILQPLPFAAGERVVTLFMLPPGLTAEHQRNPLQQMDFLRVRERARTLRRVEGYLPAERVVRTGDEPLVVKAAYATPGLFDMLTAALVEGRRFTAEEGTPGHPVALLMDGYRHRTLGDDPFEGRTLTIDGVPHAIVGVIRDDSLPAFIEADVITPLVPSAAPAPRNPGRSVVTVAELAGDVTVEQAQAEVRAIVAQLTREFPSTHVGWTGGVQTVRAWQYGAVRTPIMLLFGAAMFVLLIACVNIANLTLAQVSGRAAELSLRLALGASASDVARLQLTESLIVGLCGAAAGVLLAVPAVPALLALDPVAARALGHVALDWRVQAFTAGLGVASGVAAGLLPALQARFAAFAPGITDGSRRLAGSRTSGRVRRLLVAGEVAISIALLMAGATLLHDLSSWSRVEPGFDASHVLTAQIRLPDAAYSTVAARAQIVARLLDEVRSLPGVVAASTTMNDFVPGFSYQTMYHVEGRPTPDGQPRSCQFRRVSPGYFGVMRIRQIAGRTFDERDGTDAPQVTVISRLLADELFPGEEPVGRQLRRQAAGAQPMTIVGIVDDVNDVSVTQPAEGTLYVPWAQSNNSAVPVSFVVRGTDDPNLLALPMRRAVAAVAPDLPLRRVQTLETFVQDSLAPHRFRTLVLGAMALLGLGLATLGIYGVTHRLVVERSREFAIRVALGAAPSCVAGAVVADSIRDVAAGASVGVAAGLWLTAAISGILPATSRPDLLAVAGPVAILAIAAGAASLAPSVRVLRIDPADALRE